MTDVHDIYIQDVKILLTKNNIKIPESQNEIYDIAFDLMNNKNTSYDDVPLSIIEWMMAHNTLKKNSISEFYDIKDIELLSIIERTKLAKSLGMSGNNINNIINILRYMHKLKEPIMTEKVEEIPTYAVYPIKGSRKILMLLKPRTREVTYTPWGVQILKLNQNKLLSYQAITNIIARSNDLIAIPYIKGRSEHEIEQLILKEINKEKYEIKDIIHTDLPFYTGRYGNPASAIKVLKPLLSCQKIQYTNLSMSPKGTQMYDVLEYAVDDNSLNDDKKIIRGKNDDYIIRSSDINFKDILNDIKKCEKVYYMIGTKKHTVNFGDIEKIGHAMAIVIEPKLKLLEVYDSNGLTPDTKHVYFWITKLSEYLRENGIEVYRKINADEPYCPQGWSSLAKEFKKGDGAGQCLVWSYWYIWLRINNPDIPAEAIRKYIGEMSPDEAYDRVSRIASIVFEFDEPVDVTYAVYSRKGIRKILMLINGYRKEITYTPYGLTYLNIDRNKLPSYIESAYSVFDKEEFVQIPYIKGRASEEIEKLIDEEIKKL